MRQIVLDTETTGLEWKKGNRVVEIGCVELVERRPTGRTFHRYLNPQREFEMGAQEVTGLTVEFLADTVEVLIRVCRAGHRVVEVPVAMRQRSAGLPSTRRFRLVFNYLRLLVGILASASRHRPAKGAGS